MPGDRSDDRIEKVLAEHRAEEDKKSAARMAALGKPGAAVGAPANTGSRSPVTGEHSEHNGNYLRDRHEDRPPPDSGERLKEKSGNGGDQLRNGTDLSKKDPDSKHPDSKHPDSKDQPK